MSDFKVGDLVQFIPENFDRRLWKWAYIGIGYIESIDVREDEESVYFNTEPSRVYKIFCGKVIRQQMSNFAELELRNATVEIFGKHINTVCKKATIESIKEL